MHVAAHAQTRTQCRYLHRNTCTQASTNTVSRPRRMHTMGVAFRRLYSWLGPVAAACLPSLRTHLVTPQPVLCCIPQPRAMQAPRLRAPPTQQPLWMRRPGSLAPALLCNLRERAGRLQPEGWRHAAHPPGSYQPTYLACMWTRGTASVMRMPGRGVGGAEEERCRPPAVCCPPSMPLQEASNSHPPPGRAAHGAAAQLHTATSSCSRHPRLIISTASGRGAPLLMRGPWKRSAQ